MPSPFDALVALPQIARSVLYGLLSRKDPFVREAMGGAEPTNEEITGAAGGMPVTGVGSVGWKLTKKAPSWLQRAFESGKREIPLQEVAPKRVPIQSPGLVKNPITYELPESNIGLRQLLEQEGGAYTGLGGEEGTTRLYRGEGPGPLPISKWAQSEAHSGEWFTTKKNKAQGFQSFYDKGRLKFVDVPQDVLERYGRIKNAPQDEVAIPREIQDKLWTRFLKEQPERKLPPVSGGVDILKRKKGKITKKRTEEGFDVTELQEVPEEVMKKVKKGRKKKDVPGTFDVTEIPEVSGGAPSIFDKFTSKDLPVPQGMWDPGYKSTQDIMGAAKLRGYAEQGAQYKQPYEDWVGESSPTFTANMFRFFSERYPTNPKEALLRTTRFVSGRGAPTEVEMAAFLKNALMREPQLLNRALTPDRASALKTWMQQLLD